MKEVMQQYGSAVIAAGIGLLLFVFIFYKVDINGTNGLLQISRKMAVLQQKETTDYADEKETADVIERKNPVATFKNIKVVAGNSYDIKDLFWGEDADGNEAELKVIDLISSRVGEAAESDGIIRFWPQGNYRIWVQATDKEGKTAYNVFTIPVVCR